MSDKNEIVYSSLSSFNSKNIPSFFEELAEESENHISILESFENALFNEKSSPIILPPANNILENIIEAIQLQENALETSVNTSSHIEGYMNAIKQIEVERVKYLARSYIEVRIEKINQQIYYLTSAKAEASLMNHEKIYLKHVRHSSNRFLSSTLYAHFPKSMQNKLITPEGDINDTGLLSGSAPSLNCHITCCILEDIGEYMIDPVLLLSVECNKGDIYRMPFKAALELVLNEKARFI